jgi:LysR family cys regulon transcriptional activator
MIMQEIDSLKRIGKEYAAQDSGSFTIATTHTQARYTLPKVVQAFMVKFPKVRLSLLQGNPQQIAEMVQRDQADLCIATESIAGVTGLVTLPCYQWEHVVVVPPDHPLLHQAAWKRSRLSRSSRMMAPLPAAARSTTRFPCVA